MGSYPMAELVGLFILAVIFSATGLLVQKKIKKRYKNWAWNILAVIFLLIWNGTLGTTALLLPFITILAVWAYKVLKEPGETKEDN